MHVVLSKAIAWVVANPLTIVAIVAYILVNVLPRPDHTKMTGWKKRLWQAIDWASFLTHDKVPGKLKMLFTSSPPKPVVPPPKTASDASVGAKMGDKKP